jgi:hypothetical protein
MCLQRESYAPGTLVLVRNSQLSPGEMKSYHRYAGPYEVVEQTKRGNYRLKELDGTLWHRPIARYRVIAYVSHRSPELGKLYDEKIFPSAGRFSSASEITEVEPWEVETD